LPITAGKQQKPPLNFMPSLGLYLRLLALVIPLGLGACADTLTSDEATSSATLQRGYDKTLTKSEQKAVISDLQDAKARQEAGEAAQ
jgi:hypothetical protein